MKTRFTSYVAAIVAAGGVLSLSANDWPHWRGPDRNGISAETGWTDRLPSAGPAIAWKAQVGLGFSSFVVADGRAFTAGRPNRAPWIYSAV